MLQFNPFFRISVEEALDHPLFAKVRKADKEYSATEKVTIEFEEQTLN